MKKSSFAVILVFCMLLPLIFVSCKNDERIQIFVPDGAPALAVANIIESGKAGGYNVKVNITTGADVTAKCSGVNPEADIAVLPTNAAVKICSASGDYSIFTVNVWGLLYVLGWDNITDLSDLINKTVKSIGLGNTGEYLFKKILDEHNVSYADGGVNLEYVDDGSEAVGLLLNQKCDYALVGEPAATNAVNRAKANGKTLYRVFNLQELWQQVTSKEITGYPQASVIVKKSLLSKQGFADALYNDLFQNNAYLAQNTERLKDLLLSAGSTLNIDYTTDIIEGCNLKTVKAYEVKQDIFDYLSQFKGPFAGLLKDELYYEFKG